METKLVVQDSLATVVIGSTIAAFTYVVGGIDKLFLAFVIFVSLDFLTGFLAACYLDDVNSRKMYWGAIRKGLLVCLVIMAHQLDVIAGSNEGYMRTAMLLFIIGVEGVSILENLGKLNLPIPSFMLQAFARLRGKTIVETRITTEYHYPDSKLPKGGVLNERKRGQKD